MTFASILLALLATLPSPPVPGGRRPADVAAIRADIEEIFAAYARKDRDTIRRLHAADWRGFLRGSPGVIRGVDHYMREAEAAIGTDALLAGHTIRDFDALFYGHIALISYVADIRWTLGGPSHDDTLRIFDVYARIGGRWSQVGSHVASSPEREDAGARFPSTLSPEVEKALLAEREAVWRAFFEGDAKRLSAVLPGELVAVNAGETEWLGRPEILAASQEFRSSGARVTRLEFPRTVVQAYGDVAILYTTYVYDVVSPSGKETFAGRGTEVFVRRGKRWVNAGWHLDSGR
jgi:ketosteroid isomerase-like protein